MAPLEEYTTLGLIKEINVFDVLVADAGKYG
jgi:hypothetical protein